MNPTTKLKGTPSQANAKRTASQQHKPGRGVHPATAQTTLQKAAASNAGKQVVFPLVKGPFQNNGATPWYAELAIGSEAQAMKIALDTGSNFTWTTSTLCGSTGCVHYGEGQFNPNSFSSFEWINTTPKQVDFGPWGSMMVEEGSDNFLVRPNPQEPLIVNVRNLFYLSSSYDSQQFSELDWDGGIGLPSGSAFADPAIPPFYASLLQQGLIDPSQPFISFCTDPSNNTGTAVLGGYNLDEFDPDSAIFMPWSPYLQYSGVEYIWTSPLAQMLVSETVVATNVMFALDSGSSQFKGDDDIMNTILGLVSVPHPPNVELTLGYTMSGRQGTIMIPPSLYNVEIQAGADAGKIIPQFQPLGLENLVLVGSVLMDYLYTIFEYSISNDGSGNYTLNPIGMWLFNKTNGPKLIQTQA